MNTIRINFEYGTFPVWLYDENGGIIENDFPEYLIGDKELESSFGELQNLFDNLFINDKSEFRYVGFKSSSDEKEFNEKLQSAKDILRKKLSSDWKVEN